MTNVVLLIVVIASIAAISGFAFGYKLGYRDCKEHLTPKWGN